MTYFISGHRDLTNEEFEAHYRPWINIVCAEDPFASFVVGDCEGCDTMAVEYIVSRPNFTQEIDVYCVESPKMKPFGEDLKNFENIHIHIKQDYDVCDRTMTKLSDFDIAWIRPGKEHSHTADNIKRRYNL